MTPQQAISALDRQNAEHGEDVRVRSAKDLVGEGVVVRAFIRGYRPDELAGGVQQGDREGVISPTALATAGDLKLERNMKLRVGDRWTNIEFANPVRLRGEIVRWNLWLKG